MIILDTNVVSALMRLDREPAVAAWINRQSIDAIFVTTVTVFEVRFGLERMPAGKGRRSNELRFAQVLATLVPGRILSLDQLGADAAARLHLKRGKHKADLEAPDSLIAGIANHIGASIATRNAKDFNNLGVPLINPWVV